MFSNNIQVNSCDASVSFNNNQVVINDSVLHVKKIENLGQIYNIDVCMANIVKYEIAVLPLVAKILSTELTTLPGFNQAGLYYALNRVADDETSAIVSFRQSITIKQFMQNFISHWIVAVCDSIRVLVDVGIAPINEATGLVISIANEDTVGPAANITATANNLRKVLQAFENRNEADVNKYLDIILGGFGANTDKFIEEISVVLKLSPQAKVFVKNFFNLFGPTVVGIFNELKTLAKQN